MNRLGEWMASFWGLDPAAFDRWAFLWGRPMDTGYLLLLLLGVAGFLWVSWLSSRGVEPPRRRFLLLTLRFLAVSVLAAILLDPSISFLQTQEREERFAVLVDTSRSMSLKTPDGEERQEIVRAALQNNRRSLDRLENRFQVDYFTFDDTSRPATREGILDTLSLGATTRIGESIDSLIRGLAADPPAGILLFSDGADHGRLAAAGQNGGQLAPVPIYPVLLPEGGPPDAAVEEIIVDPYAFVRNAFEVRARISVRGLPQRSLNVTLRRDGQVIGQQRAVIPEGGDTVEVVFSTTPQRVGTFAYSVEIPTLPGDSIRENNRRFAIVRVVRDRIRVLQVVGEPSWDTRFLRSYLKNDPNVDLISFKILRTRENQDHTPEGELSLIPFPTRELFTEELAGFDLVIFQNFDYRPYFHVFPGQLLGNLRKFVEEDGGGFLMIGGSMSFASGGYARTPIEQILPLGLSGGGGVSESEFRPVLTEQGQRHPITNLDRAPEDALAIWSELPPLIGTNLVGSPKPGATTLMHHPQRRSPGGTEMPVLSVMEAGQGRSMALTADSSWRWSFTTAGEGGSTVHYQRFWNHAIRWLVQDPEFGRVRLETDRDRYAPGQPVEARCTVMDEQYRPSEGAEARIEQRSRTGDDQWKAVELDERSPGVFVGEHIPDQGGVMELRCAAAHHGESVGEDDAVVLVDEMGPELQNPLVNNALLEALAARSGGKTLMPDDRNWFESIGFQSEVNYEVIGKDVVRMWDNAVFLLVLALLLSTEWLLRRRWGGV